MATLDVLLLGLVAGLTIFLGLPVARMDNASRRVRAILSAFAIGVLLFLLVEVTYHGWHEVEEAVEHAAQGTASWGSAAAFVTVFSVGLFVGLLSLVWFENKFLRAEPAPAEGGTETKAVETPQRLALMIAVGIGLHNFSEGLAIGASAASGAVALAFALGVGFALHNATEGFGIAAPLAGTKPTWKFLGILGLIAGGPTFLGTLVGSAFTDVLVSTLFLALAAGALIYVIRQLFITGRAESRDSKHAMAVMAALAFGLLAGFGGELLIELSGG